MTVVYLIDSQVMLMNELPTQEKRHNAKEAHESSKTLKVGDAVWFQAFISKTDCHIMQNRESFSAFMMYQTLACGERCTRRTDITTVLIMHG